MSKIYVVSCIAGEYPEDQATEPVAAHHIKEAADADAASRQPKYTYDAFGSRVYKPDDVREYYFVTEVELT